jgi:hypothetical protein
MWIAQDDKTIFEDKYIIPALKFYRSQLAKVTPSSLPNVLGTLDAIFLSVAKEDIKPIVEQAFNEAADMARLNELYALGNTYGAEAARTAAFNRLNTVVNTAKTRVENFISKKETALQNSKNYEDSGDVLKATMELLAEYFVTWVTDDLDAVDATLADKAKRTYYAVTNEFSRLVKIARAAALVRQQDILDIPLTPPIGPMEQSKTLLENINNAKEDLFYVETFVDNLSDKTGTLVKGDGFDVAELKTRITKLEQLYRDEAARSDAVQRALALNATIYMSLADARDALAKNWNTKFAEANMIAAEKLNRRILAFQLLEKRDKGTTLTADERRAVEQAGMEDKLAVDATKAKQVLDAVEADITSRKPPIVGGMTVLEAMRAFADYFKPLDFNGLGDVDFAAAKLSAEYATLVKLHETLSTMEFGAFMANAENDLLLNIDADLRKLDNGARVYDKMDVSGYTKYIDTTLPAMLSEIRSLWQMIRPGARFADPTEKAVKFQAKNVSPLSKIDEIDPPFDLKKSVDELKRDLQQRKDKLNDLNNYFLKLRLQFRLDAREALISYIEYDNVYSIESLIKTHVDTFAGILDELVAVQKNRASKWFTEAIERFRDARKQTPTLALIASLKQFLDNANLVKDNIVDGKENVEFLSSVLQKMTDELSAPASAPKSSIQETCKKISTTCKEIVTSMGKHADSDRTFCTFTLRSMLQKGLTLFQNVSPEVIYNTFMAQTDGVQRFLVELMVAPIVNKLGIKNVFCVLRSVKGVGIDILIDAPSADKQSIDGLKKTLLDEIKNNMKSCLIHTYVTDTMRTRIEYSALNIYMRKVAIMLLWSRVLVNKEIKDLLPLLDKNIPPQDIFDSLKSKASDALFFNQPIALCEYHLKNATAEDIGSPAFMAQVIAPLIAASKEAEDIHNGLRGLATTQSSVEDKERYRRIMENMAAYAQTKNSDLLERVRVMWPSH